MVMTCKYYYKNEPLAWYCKRNNIHESSILFLINEKLMSVEEAVDHFWEHKDKKYQNNLKYAIDGKSVKSLLKDFKLYQRFCNKLYKSKDKNVERIYNEVKNGRQKS